MYFFDAFPHLFVHPHGAFGQSQLFCEDTNHGGGFRARIALDLALKRCIADLRRSFAPLRRKNERVQHSPTLATSNAERG
jgi:hypothetical protein